jgi:hypothetical protein
LALSIPEIEQNRRKSFWAKQKRLRIELPGPTTGARTHLAATSLNGIPRTGT